ncbi:cytochrome c biogenesis protein CcsA [Siphonobacter aquaeclarae]|uniref:Heme exporter protein C n=1 Tax=Siphonobacter aquaeclarae TaxID=563176 RepID=A0A1G9XUH3_9BACT|nr:cytochrome c biogenesis protein CcsA [Siphonobacter aquaeclarae]SDN00482.1 heme exporter protein C [Siphonobacter aquaeclarae]
MSWWKYLCILLMIYVYTGGILMPIPRQPILYETARNLYFHVPLWFAMILLLALSVWHAVQYLRSGKTDHDLQSVELANTGLVFGILGFVTGAIWGKYTWGSALPQDPKLLSTEIAMLIYLAYWVLRGSFRDDQQRARISAVYNIFAFAAFIPLTIILPRLATDSLHPGNGGNPGFKIYDSDHSMKLVFYPAIIMMMLLGYWISTLRIRYRRLLAIVEE